MRWISIYYLAQQTRQEEGVFLVLLWHYWYYTFAHICLWYDQYSYFLVLIWELDTAVGLNTCQVPMDNFSSVIAFIQYKMITNNEKGWVGNAHHIMHENTFQNFSNADIMVKSGSGRIQSAVLCLLIGPPGNKPVTIWRSYQQA